MIFRLLGSWFLIASGIALIHDVTRFVLAKSGFAVTSLLMHWAKLQPAGPSSSKDWVVRHLHPLVWDPAILSLLGAPAFVTLAVIGLALFYIGRKRRRVAVYSN